jgi:methenyltetrahydrofolate cyclohydrolase
MLDLIAAKTPSPGGGYVAAAVGALSAALAGMVLAYSTDKPSLAEHSESNAQAATHFTRARAMLLQLAHEDALAYQQLSEFQQRPEGEQDAEALLEAAQLATLAPLSSAGVCADLLRVLESLPGTTNPWLASDLAIAAILADAAVRSCLWNVRVNLPTLQKQGESPERIAALGKQIEELLAGAQKRAATIEKHCTP